MIKIKKEKKKFSNEEEFQILKLVIDKFLWIGTLVSLYGLYLVFEYLRSDVKPLVVIGVGALFLLMFTSIISINVHYHRSYKR